MITANSLIKQFWNLCEIEGPSLEAWCSEEGAIGKNDWSSIGTIEREKYQHAAIFEDLSEHVVEISQCWPGIAKFEKDVAVFNTYHQRF